MSARLFLRFIALIYLIAFWSLGTQILGLIGSQGILPVKDFLDGILQYWGPQHFWKAPTLCWFNSSDTFLLFLCVAGCVCSILSFAGILPWLNAFLLWVLYLSLTIVGQEFLGFQWDNLLLETGFLAIFLLPVRRSWRWRRDEGPSRIVIWLLRLLLFKLMFESGLVKILSGDTTWSNFTALTYHYLTQPLPNIISWYFYQLPVWFHKLSCFFVFVVELVIPFLIFCGRRARWIAFWILIGFQLLIVLTGNYCFINLLAIALCFLLLDDVKLSVRRPPLWHTLIASVIAVAVLTVSTIQMVAAFNRPLSRLAYSIVRFVNPLRTINSYGLFAMMTTERDEIIIEGSQDADTWQAYEFRWNPGDLMQPPGWVMPHQPRLDWQMWFAALGDYRQNPWLIYTMARLLQGSSPVLDLFKSNPFKDRSPRYIRAIIYEYSFTDFATKQKTKAWWQREFKGSYTPILSLTR